MLLSEAMEIGGKKYPFTSGVFFFWDHETNKIGGVCALGAVCAACHTEDQLKQAFTNSHVLEMITACGVDTDMWQGVDNPARQNAFKKPLFEMIITLVDLDGWTLEQVITWLKGLGL